MKNNLIESVENAMILLILLSEHPNIGLSELARLSNMNKSKVYRLMCTLETKQFIIKDPTNQAYNLGLQIANLGNAAIKNTHLMMLARTEMVNIHQILNENIQLRIRENDNVIQVLSFASSQVLRVSSDLGNLRPLGVGASGIILLSYAPKELQETIIERNPSYSSLVAQTQKTGICITKEMVTPGVAAIAIPILNAAKHCLAALSISLPLSRLNEEYENLIIKHLKEAATRISKLLPSH